MFRNHTNDLRADAEVLFESIRARSEEEVAVLDERKAILRDVLNSFIARLNELPERERNATSSVLYQRIIDTVFDFHLSIATAAARARMGAGTTQEEKLEALGEFQGVINDLALLYGVPI